MKKFFFFLAAALSCLMVHADVYCPAEPIPYVQSFTGHATSSGYNVVEPECWTISSQTPQVWVVIDKDSYGEVIRGTEHLYVSGGGPSTAQVFALPAFKLALNTLEVAFDYKQTLTSAAYGSLEIGYMTDPSDASTFVSLNTFAKVSSYTHAVYSLAAVPSSATHVAFRLAGGSNDLGNVAMDNFVVAAIGHSGEIDPEQDQPDPEAQAYLIGKTYCEAQFAWTSYTADAFKIDLYDAGSQQLIAAIPATTDECAMFAYQDVQAGIFKGLTNEDEHYCSTKWILNADENSMLRGAAWESSILNIGTAISPVIGLQPGSYEVQIYALNTITYLPENLLGTVAFALENKQVTNLQATVAEDKTTATITWDTPELATGERLYVSVRSGETVAYDNYESMEEVTSPLTVPVEEGKSYSAIIQIVDRYMSPMGSEAETGFTVGTNNYEPTLVHAEVFGGDNVTFSWHVETMADFYDIILFLDGEYHTTLSVYDTIKTTTMPKDGTWSWTVQAFTKGSTGKYFPASNAIAGNDFVSKAADIPEDAVVMNVWGMEAGYLDQYVDSFPENKFGWMIMFATGEEGGTGMPMPYFLIYTDKEDAISGVYNVARGNIDLESCYLNIDGTPTGCIMATDAEVRLQFVGYDDDKAASGYRYGYFTGQFRIVTTDGVTHVGKFMELFCNSFNYSTAGGIRDHKGLWDEDPDYVVPYQGIESIQPSAFSIQKVLIDGQIYIIRGDHMYDIRGQRVR